MRLKLDENLGHSIAQVFQDAGHDVATVHAQGLGSARDRDVFSTCRRERCVPITLDLDFANPLRFDPAESAGVAVLRVPSSPRRSDLHTAAATLIAQLDRADITGGGGTGDRPALRLAGQARRVHRAACR